jgi:uncharacterized membrane protein
MNRALSTSTSTPKSTLAPLERLLAGLLHYGTWVASLIIAVGFVLTLIHSNSGISHPEMMVGMRIVTTGIVLFILLPVLRLMLMFGVFLRERDYRFSAIAALVLLIVAAGCVAGAYLAPSMAG